MSTAVIAIPVATAAGANASPHSPQAAASSLHVGVRLGGLRAKLDIDRCSVSEQVTGRLLGIKQGVSISC